MTTRGAPTPSSSVVATHAHGSDHLIEPKPLAPNSQPPRIDPLTRERRRRTRSAALWILAIAASAIPLAIPRAAPSVPLEETVSRPSQAQPTQIASLNLASFDAPVWLTRLEAPPAPEVRPSPVAPAPPSPPPRLELLGIERSEDDQGALVYRAVLYDQDAKRVLVVKAGDRLEKSARTIATVTPTDLTITDGSSTHTLALKTPPPMPPIKTK
ncbi:MAG: hypothetical protein AB7Q00_08005 [Phycisphaerales bacterium]